MMVIRAVFFSQRGPRHLGCPGTLQPLWLTSLSKRTWVDWYSGTSGSTPAAILGSVSFWPARHADVASIVCKDKGLDILYHMDQHGCVPSVSLYRYLLKACTKKKDLNRANQIHAHITKHGLEFDRSLGEYVVSTLVTCGGLRDAVQLFHRLPSRTVFSWTALISGYAVCGQAREAIMMYRLMLEDLVEPNGYTFVSLLKACSALGDFRVAKRIHAEAVKHRCELDIFVGSCLVAMYGKFGSIADAWDVFIRLPQRNVVCWTAILGAYVQHGQPGKVLQLYDQMQEEMVSPDVWTFVTVLQACGVLAEAEVRDLPHGLPAKPWILEKGRQIQADVTRRGCSSNVFVGNTMISMFGKCGSTIDARNVFDSLVERDVVSWNALLAAYVLQGEAKEALQLCKQMDDEGVSPNDCTINTLVSLYGRHGNITNVQTLFDQLSRRDVMSWNTLLAVYFDRGEGEKILELYKQMQEEGVSPNLRTLVIVLQACGLCAQKQSDVQTSLDRQSIMVRYLEIAKELHADAYSKNLGFDVFLGSTLISVYGKCGSLSDARNVFTGLLHRNVVSWNAMLSAYLEHGQGRMALDLYEHMLLEVNNGVVSDARTIVSAIQACSILAEKEEDIVLEAQWTKVHILGMVRALHAEAWKKGFDSNKFVAIALVGTYGKCGSVADSYHLFDGLPLRDVVAWSVMLSAIVDAGQGEKALHLYEQMLVDGVSPNGWTFTSALQACEVLATKEQIFPVDGQPSRFHSLNLAKAIHAAAYAKGCDANLHVGSALISLYGLCGSTLDARFVFDKLSNPDVVSWNAILTAYVDQGLAEEALQLYEQMWADGVNPDDRSLVSVLQACGMLADHAGEASMDRKRLNPQALWKGKTVHAIFQSSGDMYDVFVANTLIVLYSKCGSIVDAQNVFDTLSQRDEVTWNVMLAACVEQGHAEDALQLYGEMCEAGISPDVRTFVSTIQACGIRAMEEEGVRLDGGCTKFQSLKGVKELHAVATKKGFDSNIFVGNTLVSAYGKCGSLLDAQNVFQGLSKRDVVSWNAMLAACVQQGQDKLALGLYEQLLEEGRSPDARSFVSALQACSRAAETDNAVVANGHCTKLDCLEMGKAMHADIQRRGCDKDIFVSNTLVSMYRRCGSMADAQDVFDALSKRNVVSWTIMLGAYVERGEAFRALQLYVKMQEASVSPNAWTFVYVLRACGMLADDENAAVRVTCLEMGKAIHCDIQRMGYDSDVRVGSALVSMYGKCGSIVDAESVFSRLSTGNVELWTAMLAAHVEQGEAGRALQLCRHMPVERTNPDDVTFLCILRACTCTGTLAIVRQIHHTVSDLGNELELSPTLANSLISAYGRCASMAEAQTVFNSLSHPDVVSWNSLIAGYARKGDTGRGLQSYEQMRVQGVAPNGVTFLSLLSACSHAGSVDIGVGYFESMSRDYGLAPEIEHYVSMVDLLGRAGCFTSIDELMSTMPMQPNLAIWLCLLSAYRKHGKVSLAEKAFRRAVQLEATHPAAYVLMSNIYADAGHIELAKKLKDMRERGGAWKRPGQTWIEHEEAQHAFMVNDTQHPQQELLHDLLHELGALSVLAVSDPSASN